MYIYGGGGGYAYTCAYMLCAYTHLYAHHMCAHGCGGESGTIYACTLHGGTHMHAHYMDEHTCMHITWRNTHVCTLHGGTHMYSHYMEEHTCMHITWRNTHVCTLHDAHGYGYVYADYGVATISRLLKMKSLLQNIVSLIGLFCKRDL